MRSSKLAISRHDGADIAEFSQHWSSESAYTDDIPHSGRLFSPIGIFITSITWRNRKRSWQVVHKDPDYYPGDLCMIPFLASAGSNGAFEYYTLNDIKVTLGSVSDAEVTTGAVCSILPQHPDWIARTVDDRLALRIRRPQQ